MNATKRRGWLGLLSMPIRPVLAPLAGNGRGVFALAALAIVLIAGGYLGWARWGGAITRQSRYVLTAESLEITPQPSWVHVDVKSEVMRDGSLADLSLLDPELTKRVARAFELHSWVAKVVQVLKRPGTDAPRIIVDVRYREPVIMVKTRDGFWPVDTRGVLLPPNEFSPNQTRNYLRVYAQHSQPAGPVGTQFGDVGVVGAASIAQRLRSVWKPMGLEWIVIRRDMPRTTDQPLESTYLLLPRGVPPTQASQHDRSPVAGSDVQGRAFAEIWWGHAPGREPVGEATADEKVARLVKFVKKNGPLEKLTRSVTVDLRPGPGISVIDKKNGFQPVGYSQ